MCEWLIDQGIEFDIHKVLPNGRVCDFYFDGTYWELDGMDRVDSYFVDKYDELPYMVVTPENYEVVVSERLNLDHVHNGVKITSIETYGDAMTYDVEMQWDGPLNYLASDIVSHNSHVGAYDVLGKVQYRERPGQDGTNESEMSESECAPELLVDDIVPIDEARSLAQGVEAPVSQKVHERLYIDMTKTTPSDVERMKSVLSTRKGESELILRRWGKEQTSALRIAATQDTLRSVSNIVGRANAWLE